jgi:hypothetical protein
VVYYQQQELQYKESHDQLLLRQNLQLHLIEQHQNHYLDFLHLLLLQM